MSEPPLPELATVRLPLPPIAPESVALLPSVSKVPPPVLSVIVRALVNPDKNCSVPPPNVSPPEAAPRLASAETASVPWLIVHGVTAVVVPVKVQVLVPVFS